MNKIRSHLSQEFAEKVYYGLWFSPECDYIRACLKLSQKLVNGFVILQLYKGNSYIRGREANNSLYNQQLVRYSIDMNKFELNFINEIELIYLKSMDIKGDFTPSDAEGFIKISALRLTTFKNIYKYSPYN